MSLSDFTDDQIFAEVEKRYAASEDWHPCASCGRRYWKKYGNHLRCEECVRFRDQFAEQAMQAMVSIKEDEFSWEVWAHAAYRAADAMLRERIKPREAE